MGPTSKQGLSGIFRRDPHQVQYMNIFVFLGAVLKESCLESCAGVGSGSSLILCSLCPHPLNGRYARTNRNAVSIFCLTISTDFLCAIFGAAPFNS